MSIQVNAPEGQCRTYERLSGITSSTGFTLSKLVYKGQIAVAVLIVVETAAIRFMMSGDDAVVTGASEAGAKIDSGQSFVVRGTETTKNFRCINETAGNGAKAFCYFYF